MQIAPLAPSDRDAARALLVANALPVDDLDDPAIALFVARTDDVLAGVVGIQRCGTFALLRSLAVASTARSRGIGDQLCRHAIADAGARGLADVYLLTTSARDYFIRFGFIVIDRRDVPQAVRASAQFVSLCPASATIMRRP